MSTALFPNLPGLTWDLDLVPSWSTVIQRSSTRQEARLAQDIYPLYTFELEYEFLRDDSRTLPTSVNPLAYSELAQLVAFYNARGGSFDSFLLDPLLITAKPGFGAVRGLQIGTGDGTTTSFQLLWSWGGYIDEVQAVKGTPVVYVNSAPVPASAWTLQPLGEIQFDEAPAQGAVVAADCDWYWKVRFQEDTLEFKSFMCQLYEAQSVKLQQVRDE